MRLVRFEGRHVLLAAAVAIPLAVSAVVALAASGHHLYPWGDHAVLELETNKAGQGHQLVGTYSRYQWSHPGPVLFYLLVPLYWLSGHASPSLAAGAALLNLVWVAAIVLVAGRLGGARAALWAAFLCAAYLVILGPRMTRDFWVPHTVMLSFGAYVVASAGLAAGRIALLPVAVGLACFLAQTDLSVAPATAAVLIAALVLFALSAWRQGAPVSLRLGRWLPSWPYAAALLLAAVIWWPPVQNELTHSPGNFSTIKHFFEQSYTPHSLGEAKSAVASALATLPLGVSKALIAAPAPHGRQIFAAFELLLIGAGVAVAWLRGRWFAFSLCALSLVAVGTEIYAATKVRGDMFTYLFEWISAVSVAGWLGIGLALAPELRALSGRRVALTRDKLAVALAAGVGVLLAVNLVQTANAGSPAGDLPFRNHVAKQLDLRVEAWLSAHGYRSPTVMIPYNPVWPEAATFIVERYKHARPVAADPAYLFMFGRDLAPTGREDISLYYVAAGQEGLIANKRRRLIAQVGQDAVYAIPNLAATS